MSIPLLNREFSVASITYSWRCAECGKIAERQYELHKGGPVLLAGVPDGWVKVNDAFFCPNHELQLMVDAKPISIPF